MKKTKLVGRGQRTCTGIWLCPGKCKNDPTQHTVYNETYYSDSRYGKTFDDLSLNYSKRVCTVCGYTLKINVRMDPPLDESEGIRYL